MTLMACPFCEDTVHEVLAEIVSVPVVACPMAPADQITMKLARPVWVVHPSAAKWFDVWRRA